MSNQVLFVRQPVFNRQLESFAFLLRCAEAQAPDADFYPDAENCSTLLFDACCGVLEKGQMRVLPAIMQVSLDWVRNSTPPQVVPEKLILDLVLSAHDVISADDLRLLKQLREQGYALVTHFDAPRHVQALADYIHLNLQQSPEADIEAVIAKARAADKQVYVSGVDSYDQYERCNLLSIDLFQGEFFARPRPVAGRHLSAQETVMLQLIAEVHDPEVSPEELEVLFQRDPTLVVGLLRLVNSAVFRGQRQIKTIKEAIILLGMNELRKWVLLFSISRCGGKPAELMRLLLIRAKMCESIARIQPGLDPSTAFLAGVLSGLDALLDIPRDELLQQLPVALEVKRALNGGNALGSLLANVEAYCTGGWGNLSPRELTEIYPEAYEQALAWCNEAISNL